MSSNDKTKSEIIEGPASNEESESETIEKPASNSDMSAESLTKRGSPEQKPQPEPKKNADPETGSIRSQQSLSQRFLTWTRNDLFDFNPAYAMSLRGIFNFLHIVFSMFVMALVGSACYTADSIAKGFYCTTSGTFTYVIACSAFIQSIIFCACCLLSKEGDKRIHATTYEVVYYITYAVFFVIASLAITTSVSSRDPQGNYHVNLGGGVFGFFTAISYACSAIWFCLYHRLQSKKMDDENEEGNQLESTSTS